MNNQSTRMKLLIAYDGSNCAKAALDLQRAGLPREADVLVVSVAEVWLPPPPPSSYEVVDAFRDEETTASPGSREAESLMTDATAKALEAARLVQSSSPHWDVQAQVYCGSPASELLQKADEWKPDLIIVGSHGRSVIGRLILGSVSYKIATEACCSVLIARDQAGAAGSPVRIVIGADGSPGAEAAAGAVASRVWPSGSEARVIAVYDIVTPTIVGTLIPPVPQWVEDENKATHERARRMAGSIAEQLSSTNLKVSTVVKAGDPKQVLVAQARSWKADCIFVGARGLSRIARFLLGSVSAAVAARAHCSVEVVRPRTGSAA